MSRARLPSRSGLSSSNSARCVGRSRNGPNAIACTIATTACGAIPPLYAHQHGNAIDAPMYRSLTKFTKVIRIFTIYYHMLRGVYTVLQRLTRSMHGLTRPRIAHGLDFLSTRAALAHGHRISTGRESMSLVSTYDQIAGLSDRHASTTATRQEPAERKMLAAVLVRLL